MGALGVEMGEGGIVEEILIARPFIELHTGLHHVKVGIEVVPELLVIEVVGGSRLVVAVDFPVGTPVLGFADILGKAVHHVLVVGLEAEHFGTDGLVGDIAHAEGFALGQGRLIPGAYRVGLPVVCIAQGHLACPSVDLIQFTVVAREERRLFGGRHHALLPFGSRGT